MARKSDWSQDSDTEWTFSRGGVQATIDLEQDYDGYYGDEYHAMIVDDNDVVMDGWYESLEAAKAEVESIVRGIV